MQLEEYGESFSLLLGTWIWEEKVWSVGHMSKRRTTKYKMCKTGIFDYDSKIRVHSRAEVMSILKSKQIFKNKKAAIMIDYYKNGKWYASPMTFFGDGSLRFAYLFEYFWLPMYVQGSRVADWAEDKFFTEGQTISDWIGKKMDKLLD